MLTQPRWKKQHFVLEKQKGRTQIIYDISA